MKSLNEKQKAVSLLSKKFLAISSEGMAVFT